MIAPLLIKKSGPLILLLLVVLYSPTSRSAPSPARDDEVFQILGQVLGEENKNESDTNTTIYKSNDSNLSTVCWIETTTIAQRADGSPPKAYKDYSVVLQTPGDIQKESRNTDKVQEFLIVDETTHESKILSFVFESKIDGISYSKNKTLKCGSGNELTETLRESPKRRTLEIKVRPKHALEPSFNLKNINEKNQRKHKSFLAETMPKNSPKNHFRSYHDKPQFNSPPVLYKSYYPTLPQFDNAQGFNLNIQPQNLEFYREMNDANGGNGQWRSLHPTYHYMPDGYSRDFDLNKAKSGLIDKFTSVKDKLKKSVNGITENISKKIMDLIWAKNGKQNNSSDQKANNEKTVEGRGFYLGPKIVEPVLQKGWRRSYPGEDVRENYYDNNMEGRGFGLKDLDKVIKVGKTVADTAGTVAGIALSRRYPEDGHEGYYENNIEGRGLGLFDIGKAIKAGAAVVDAGKTVAKIVTSRHYPENDLLEHHYDNNMEGRGFGLKDLDKAIKVGKTLANTAGTVAGIALSRRYPEDGLEGRGFGMKDLNKALKVGKTLADTAGTVAGIALSRRYHPEDGHEDDYVNNIEGRGLFDIGKAIKAGKAVVDAGQVVAKIITSRRYPEDGHEDDYVNNIEGRGFDVADKNKLFEENCEEDNDPNLLLKVTLVNPKSGKEITANPLKFQQTQVLNANDNEIDTTLKNLYAEYKQNSPKKCKPKTVTTVKPPLFQAQTNPQRMLVGNSYGLEQEPYEIIAGTSDGGLISEPSTIDPNMSLDFGQLAPTQGTEYDLPQTYPTLDY